MVEDGRPRAEEINPVSDYLSCNYFIFYKLAKELAVNDSKK